MRFYRWLSSWATTLRIKFFEPEIYRQLSHWTDDDAFPDDFVEVGEPE